MSKGERGINHKFGWSKWLPSMPNGEIVGIDVNNGSIGSLDMDH